ncbi:MAG: hypothetical protein LKJ86_05500 [Oscillibacter sp.]|nr:hypothetical protein [Oscillibacter sp.]
MHAAIDYYLSAAKLGDALAYTNIGYLYEKGQGVKKDVNEALNWYRMAAMAGEDRAKAALNRLSSPQ